MSLKEYGLKATAVEEWLPWGGIVHPNVMRQKDGSLFGVIQYDTYPDNLTEPISAPEFRRGWTMWIEHQHIADQDLSEDKNFLVLCWNPWYSSTKLAVENSLGKKKVSKNHPIEYFVEVLQKLGEAIGRVTPCHMLAYQEILDFLCFSISLGEEHVEMPDIPLYMDALLSQDLKFEFGSNAIKINGKRLVILTLPEMLNGFFDLFDHVSSLNYRYVRRILLFSEKEAQRDLVLYTSKWCPQRKNIRKMELDNLLGKINGYYQEHFFFLLNPVDYEPFLDYLRDMFETIQQIYIIESFNLKEVFWGSLPGLFLANAKPPIVGFSSLDDLLFREHIDETRKEGKFDHIIEQMGKARGATPEEEHHEEEKKPVKRLSSLSDADIKDNLQGDLARQQSGASNINAVIRDPNQNNN